MSSEPSPICPLGSTTITDVLRVVRFTVGISAKSSSSLADTRPLRVCRLPRPLALLISLLDMLPSVSEMKIIAP